MKQIFDAIRAKKDRHSIPGAQALINFEQRNRGHRQLIDELALEMATSPTPYYTTNCGKDLARDARLRTLRSTTSLLLKSAAELGHDDQFSIILHAKDETGLLQHLALQQLTWSNMEFNRESKLFKLAQPEFQFKNGTLTMSLKLYGGLSKELIATRSFELHDIALDSLAGCLDMRKKWDQQLSQFIESARSLPELSPALDDKLMKARMKSRFESILKENFTKEERLWLSKNPTLLSI